jgi:hypothetical protein
MPRTKRINTTPAKAARVKPLADAATQTDARRSKQSRQAEREIIVTLRLPRELHARLKELGGERGLTAEIRGRLEASFADPRFADLLTTIGYAASAAARTYLPRKVVVSPGVAAGMLREGKQIDPKRREVEDISAHWLFEASLQMLLDAFRPNGIPASLNDAVASIDPARQHDAAMAEILRRADRIVGAALGALGERGLVAFNRLAPIDQETIAASGPTGRRVAADAEKRLDEGETER